LAYQRQKLLPPVTVDGGGGIELKSNITSFKQELYFPEKFTFRKMFSWKL
jgi:hypothetical protein